MILSRYTNPQVVLVDDIITITAPQQRHFLYVVLFELGTDVVRAAKLGDVTVAGFVLRILIICCRWFWKGRSKSEAVAVMNYNFQIDKSYQQAFIRILLLTILFTSVGIFVLWDYYRVNRDFTELKALLNQTRNQAISKDKVLVARFASKDIVVRGGDADLVIKSLNIPTLDQVNYDTILGDNMIVFSGDGTT